MGKFLLYYTLEFSYTALCVLHHLLETKRLLKSRKHKTQEIHRALACSSVPESSSYLCRKVGIFFSKMQQLQLVIDAIGKNPNAYFIHLQHELQSLNLNQELL